MDIRKWSAETTRKGTLKLSYMKDLFTSKRKTWKNDSHRRRAESKRCCFFFSCKSSSFDKFIERSVNMEANQQTQSQGANKQAMIYICLYLWRLVYSYSVLLSGLKFTPDVYLLKNRYHIPHIPRVIPPTCHSANSLLLLPSPAYDILAARRLVTDFLEN